MSAAASPDRVLSRLLTTHAAAGASGVLRAKRGKLARLFCLERGWLVYGASNLVEEQFEEYLVRQRVLAPSARAAAVAAAAAAKKTVASMLADDGVLDAEVLRKGMERLIESLLASCLEWPDGEYRFSPGKPDLEGRITVRLAPVQLLLQHARRFPVAVDAVRVRLGPPDLRPRRTAEGDRLIQSLENGGTARFLLERSDGTCTLGQLLGMTPASEEETLRALYGLFLVGAVEPAERRRPMQARPEAPLTEEECIAVLGRADGADHYGVLGLDHHATAEQIRSAYYGLARRYHPDRFRSGAMSRFLGSMEGYFAKVTEAHNTLSNRELREAYDRHLAQKAAEPEAAVGTAHLARQNFLRARDLIERKRLAEAATYLENAIHQDDSQAEYHLELGKLLTGNPRRRPDAEEHLLRAVEIEPSSAEPYVALGHLYRRAGRNGEAARMFREALRWEPGHAEAAAQLAEIGDTAEPVADGLLRHLFRS